MIRSQTLPELHEVVGTREVAEEEARLTIIVINQDLALIATIVVAEAEVEEVRELQYRLIVYCAMNSTVFPNVIVG